MSLIKNGFDAFRTYIRHIDLTILIIYILLSLIGLVMIYSASMVPAIRNGLEPTHYFIRQSQFIALGFFLVLIIYNAVPVNLLRIPVIHMLIVFGCIMMLFVTFLFGTEVNGQKNWLYFGPIGIQPSEFIKVALILYAAQVVHTRRNSLDNLQSFTGPFIVITFISVWVVFQDFGTGAVLAATLIGIFVFVGFKLRVYLAAVSAIIGGVFILWLQGELRGSPILNPYQISRIETFLDPFQDPLRSGYQITNSLIAISRGGWVGNGVGDGVMKLGYIPEPHTDFIFAVIAEELGLIGVLGIMILFILLVFKILYYAVKTDVMFYKIVCVGVALYISIQMFLNIGGISKVIPLTGVPLPFISAGGSSYLSLSMAIGIVLLIARNIRKNELHSA